MCTRLKGGRALGGRFSTALGRGNYHSGLISVRQGGHYIGCGEGQPEADHIVVGCFDQDARTLTGFLEIHGPDLSITRSLECSRCPKGYQTQWPATSNIAIFPSSLGSF